MARLVATLADAKAAAICFDVVFSEVDRAPSAVRADPVVEAQAIAATNSDGDVDFARALADRSVVLSELVSRSGFAGKVSAKSGFTFIGEDPTPDLPHLVGVLGPLTSSGQERGGNRLRQLAGGRRPGGPPRAAADRRQRPDSAELRRRVPAGRAGRLDLSVKSADAGGSSLGQGAGVAAIKVGDLVVPTQPAGDIRAYFAEPDPSLSSPAWKLLEPGVDLSDLAGKIVVVGASASLLSDVVATPLNPSTPGVEAQAQLIEQISTATNCCVPTGRRGRGRGGDLLSLALVVATPLLSALWSAIFGAFAVAAMAGGSWLAFTHYGSLLDPVTPSYVSGAVFLAGVLALYNQKRRQLSETRSHFGRFVSPAVVARLAEHPEAKQIVLCPCCTSFSWTLSPQEALEGGADGGGVTYLALDHGPRRQPNLRRSGQPRHAHRAAAISTALTA